MLGLELGLGVGVGIEVLGTRGLGLLFVFLIFDLPHRELLLLRLSRRTPWTQPRAPHPCSLARSLSRGKLRSLASLPFAPWP